MHSELFLGQCTTYMTARFALETWRHHGCNVLHTILVGLQEETKGRAVAEARNVRGKGFRRLSEGTPNQAVKFPVQCLQLHDTVAWWVGDQVYPVLLKDSLLNTNTAIDISTFLQLASAVGSKNDAKNLKARKGVTSNLEVSLFTFYSFSLTLSLLTWLRRRVDPCQSGQMTHCDVCAASADVVLVSGALH